MFGLGKKKKNAEPVAADTSKDFLERVVFTTMPERFFLPEQKKSRAHGKIFYFILAFGLFVGIGAGAWFAYTFLTEPTAQNTQKSASSDENKKSTSLLIETPPSDEPEKEEPKKDLPPQDETDSSEEKTPDASKPATQAIDSDEDGLTDLEESLFGTHIRKSDTDGDGYSDANELKNLYDPAQPAMKLESSKSVASHQNSLAGFSLLYPVRWQVRDDDPLTSFQDMDGDKIDVRYAFLKEGNSFESWYAQVKPFDAALETFEKQNETGRAVYRGAGKTQAMIVFKDKVILLEYKPATEAVLFFLSTFDMMIKSVSELHNAS